MLTISHGKQARELVPEYDQFGMIIPESLDREDPWPARVAQADALCAMGPAWTTQDIIPLFDFLVVQQSLGDRNEAVRTRMLAVSVASMPFYDHLIDAPRAGPGGKCRDRSTWSRTSRKAHLNFRRGLDQGKHRVRCGRLRHGVRCPLVRSSGSASQIHGFASCNSSGSIG